MGKAENQWRGREEEDGGLRRMGARPGPLILGSTVPRPH